MVTGMIKRIALTLGIIYFAIATYGGSYYVCPAMVFVLSFWLYQDLKYAKSEIAPSV